MFIKLAKFIQHFKNEEDVEMSDRGASFLEKQGMYLEKHEVWKNYVNSKRDL